MERPESFVPHTACRCWRPGSVVKGPAPHDERIQVAFLLKSNDLLRNHPVAQKVAKIDSLPPLQRPQLSRQELELLNAAPDEHFAALQEFAR